MSGRSLSALALMLLAFATSGSAANISYASDTTWTVFQEGNNIGFAQAVCLNSTSPNPCPSGATQFGFPAPGWPSLLSAIPGAEWIWAPGVTGTSPTGVELSMYTFSKTLSIPGTPTGGTLLVSADDFAAVLVNGTQAASVGSIVVTPPSVTAQSLLAQFDITPYLHSGANTIEVVGQNGPGFFGTCSNCTYAQNPAGVAFGGVIQFTPSAVPEPATAWLLAAPGILFLVRRLRNRA
jgi:hypothetical protein